MEGSGAYGASAGSAQLWGAPTIRAAAQAQRAASRARSRRAQWAASALDVADHLEHHADVIDGVPPELMAAYRAFRRERRPDDGLDPGMSRAFPSFGDPRMGLNPAMSRRVLAADGTAAYLVPGDGVVALIDDWGGSVLGIDQALDGTGIGTSFRGTGRLRVQGLLPDGVDAVRIVRRNGDEIRVTVSEHLYAADVHAATSNELPAEVLFSNRGRERRLRVPGADDEILRLRSPSPQPN